LAAEKDGSGAKTRAVPAAKGRTFVGTIVIRCPKTERVISTGLQADWRAFGSVPVFFSRTYCPLCRTNHEWFAKDAWVREDQLPRNFGPARAMLADS
jgi:hypothetical protein